MEFNRLTDDLVFRPDNGCVFREHRDEDGKVVKRELLVRFVYANRTMRQTLLEAIKQRWTRNEEQVDELRQALPESERPQEGVQESEEFLSFVS